MFFLFTLSSLLYFALSFLSVCKLEKNKQRILEFFCLLIIIITAASREFFQTNSDDMIRYYDSYIMASKTGYFEYIKLYGRELLFESLNWILAWLTSGVLNVNQYAFVIISPTVFFSYCFYKRISPNENISIALLCLLIPGLMLIETQLVRQTMGFFIFLYSMTISRTSYKILLILSALMIHSTTIFFVLLWFFSDKILIRFFRLTNGFFVFPIFISCYFIGFQLTNNFSNLIIMLTKLPFVGYKANFLTTVDLVPFAFAKLYFVFFVLTCFACAIIFSSKEGTLAGINTIFKFRLNELQVKFLSFSYTLCCFILIFSFIGQLVDRFIVLAFSSLPIFIIYFLNSIKIARFKIIGMYPCVVFLFFIYNIFMLLQPSYFSLFDGIFE